MQEQLDEDAGENVGMEDLILELCTHFKGWTWDYVLDLPVQRFWNTINWLGRRRKREARAHEKASRSGGGMSLPPRMQEALDEGF